MDALPRARSDVQSLDAGPLSPADSELVELLRAKQDDLAAFCARKWNSGFSREMTSSVARILGGFAREA